MADHPQSARPLSPHLQIYRWPVTMATSIIHRFTGVGLTGGTIILAWWLIAAASGPEAYADFLGYAHTLLGQIVLFGVTLAAAYHLFNGIRHLAWDMGYGFAVKTANATGILVFALSLVAAIAFFAYAGGYVQ
jgi:succinate dehydrogenase / fumarate reductase cytochrome b subunit